MVFVTPKIRNLGVPAQSATHSGPGFGLRAQICSRTRWSNRKSATPGGHSHLSGNPKFDSSQKVMKVIKGASPRTLTPHFRLALMSYVSWLLFGSQDVDRVDLSLTAQRAANSAAPRTGMCVPGRELPEPETKKPETRSPGNRDRGRRAREWRRQSNTHRQANLLSRRSRSCRLQLQGQTVHLWLHWDGGTAYTPQGCNVLSPLCILSHHVHGKRNKQCNVNVG